MELLNGHHTMKQRHRILQKFHEAGRNDARVLLMSAVGSVGLNITCAHIVIFLVNSLLSTARRTFWSLTIPPGS